MTRPWPVFFVLLFMAIAEPLLLASANNIAKQPECSGAKTFLQIGLLEHARHDASWGRVSLRLTDRESGKILFQQEREGFWFCLGFNSGAGDYVLGGLFEIGALLPLRQIAYLNEAQPAWRESRLNQNDEALSWLAFTAVSSPQGGYVVLVGEMGESGIKLLALDTAADRMRIIGKAPAPPPLPNENWQESVKGLGGDIHKDKGWKWELPYVDGYTAMDEGIIIFTTEQKVRVSYGRDTPRSRARKRSWREFDLSLLFNKSK